MHAGLRSSTAGSTLPIRKLLQKPLAPLPTARHVPRRLEKVLLRLLSSDDMRQLGLKLEICERSRNRVRPTMFIVCPALFLAWSVEVELRVAEIRGAVAIWRCQVRDQFIVECVSVFAGTALHVHPLGGFASSEAFFETHALRVKHLAAGGMGRFKKGDDIA